MAALNYYTKYYKEIRSQGHTWRLEILQQTNEPIQEMEIGAVLQGLRLYIQGDQADIDTPIVKTSLEMVFVDAPDLDGGKKCGNWEEFYTSNATEYKVCLYKDDTLEWTGYITPDSFSEDLQYRGSVTIIARDNLGALQDFEYDGAMGIEESVVSLSSLISKALDVISFPMNIQSFYGGGGSRHRLRSQETGIRVDRLYFNSRAFVGKTWQEVLERVLYATGMTLRYIGTNTFVIAPLCDIPLFAQYYHSKVPLVDFQFVAYGQRELNPAIKRVTETIDYNLQENLVDMYMPNICYGEESSYLYGSQYTNEYNDTLPVHNVVGGLFRVLNEDETSNLFNAFAYPVKGRFAYGKGGEIQDPDIIYVAANYRSSSVSGKARTGFSVNVPAGKYNISFEVNKAIGLYDDNTTIGYLNYIQNSNFFWQFAYSAQFDGEDGSVKVLNNIAGTINKDEVWEDGPLTGFVRLKGDGFPVQVESAILETEVAGRITIKLHPASMLIVPVDERSSRGSYLGIKKFTINSIDNNGYSINDRLRINTNYNNKNNIVYTRTPEYAPNPSKVISPLQILNGMFLKHNGEYIGTEDWVFYNNDIPHPLSVLIHKQVLTYGAKPNNVLSGDIITNDANFSSLWLWNGKKHILTSGMLNVLNGRIENATLKEYLDYDYMWGTWVDRDYVEVDAAQQPLILRVNSIKDLTFSDITIDDWIYLDSLSHEGDGLYELQISVARNDTGERRSGIIIIDTAAITIVQEA